MEGETGKTNVKISKKHFKSLLDNKKAVKKMRATVKTYQYLIESGGLVINLSEGSNIVKLLEELKKFKTPLLDVLSFIHNDDK